MTDGVSDLAQLSVDVTWPDHEAATRAHDSLVTGPDLGQLARVVEWIAGARGTFPISEIARARLVVVATDHPVAGVSAYPPQATDDAVEAIESGRSAVTELAELAGAGVRVERLASPAGRIDVEDAMTIEAAGAAIRRGAEVADDEIDSGTDLLLVGNLGKGSTTIAAAMIAVLTGSEPAKVIGRGGSQIDDLMWMQKVTAIRDARRRGWLHRSEPQALLAAIGGPDIAALAGLLTRAAARHTPVLLDGVVTVAAALLASAETPRAGGWWRAAQRTAEPAQMIALNRLTSEPMLNLGMAAGDGSGALLALSVLRGALTISANRQQALQRTRDSTNGGLTIRTGEGRPRTSSTTS